MSMTPRKWYLPDYTLCREFDRTEYPVHAAKRGRIAIAYRQDDARAIAALPDLVDAHEPNRMGPSFLDWIADRLVHVYGESENADFIVCLRRRAEKARAALNKA